MIYLDASATTPVKKEVLEEFNRVSNEFIGNPNSTHELGVKANHVIEEATNSIANLFNIKPSEIIYTSGASESNNLAIKGIAFKHGKSGKHIITSRFEHPSTIGPLGWLQKIGFEVDLLEFDDHGKIDLNHLKSILREDTILVTLSALNSELGITQPIEDVGKILKEYPNCYFHVDMTQEIGKEPIDLNYIDLASISAHKFYGIKGIGALIKKDNVEIEPLIHGGSSTTIYRSGTPAPALIASLAKALELATTDLDNNLNRMKIINDYLRKELSLFNNVVINSPDDANPYILNFSVVGANPKEIQRLLSDRGVYISIGTACQTGYEVSPSVLALTGNEEIASSSMRISLTNNIEKADINEFLKLFKECLEVVS